MKALRTIPLMLVAVLGATLATQAVSIDSPLDEKAAYFQARILEKHWQDGLYMSIVPVTDEGETPDHTVTGPCNVIHAGVWTGRYLGGVAYQYAVTRDPRVREHGGRILRALRVLQEVTGKPGLLARGYVRGHGPTTYERMGDSAEWHQGQGEYADYRFYSDVSVDNFNAVLYGYALFHDYAADDEQKRMIARDVDRLMTHVLDNGFQIIDLDGERTRYGRIGVPVDDVERLRSRGREPGLRSYLMLLPDLLIAHHVTGRERYIDTYNEIVKRSSPYAGAAFSEADLTPEQLAQLDHSPEGQAYEALFNLIRYERDPELRQIYADWTWDLWQRNKMEGNTVLTFMTAPFFAEVRDDKEVMDAAVTTLRLFPVDKVMRPVMNSINPDLPTGPVIVPMNVRVLDNEYEWKGNPYRRDGYLKPTVRTLEVSCDDPLVQYVCDATGAFYTTTDGGTSWVNRSHGLQGAAVRQIAASPRRTFIVVAATDRGVYTTLDGGLLWRSRNDGLGSTDVRQLAWHPDQPGTLYARTASGLFKTTNLGDKWTKCSLREASSEDADEPEHTVVAVAIDPQSPTTVYAVESDGNLVVSKNGGALWQSGRTVTARADTVTSLVVHPDDRQRLYVTTSAEGVFRSADGGGKWKPSNAGLPSLNVTSIAVSPASARVLYATVADAGLFRSEDFGETWREHNTGLPIPRAGAVFSDPRLNRLLVSTPGGFFELTDRGRQWREIKVWPEHETGSADFLHAYWMGRYYGYIPNP